MDWESFVIDNIESIVGLLKIKFPNHILRVKFMESPKRPVEQEEHLDVVREVEIRVLRKGGRVLVELIHSITGESIVIGEILERKDANNPL